MARRVPRNEQVDDVVRRTLDQEVQEKELLVPMTAHELRAIESALTVALATCAWVEKAWLNGDPLAYLNVDTYLLERFTTKDASEKQACLESNDTDRIQWGRTLDRMSKLVKEFPGHPAIRELMAASRDAVYCPECGEKFVSDDDYKCSVCRATQEDA